MVIEMHLLSIASQYFNKFVDIGTIAEYFNEIDLFFSKEKTISRPEYSLECVVYYECFIHFQGSLHNISNYKSQELQTDVEKFGSLTCVDENEVRIV